jgi:hypothetical protein
MNSTSVTFVNNSTATTVESWFITVDILGMTCICLATILTIIYLFIIVVDKTCHTVRMILVGNIFLTGFICGSALFAITVFTLKNDLKQIRYQDSLCIFRGYLSYGALASHVYSYLLSAMYQYMSIVYPNRLFWKSARTQIFLIVLSWIWTIVFPIPVTVTGTIIYNSDNQICQVPFRFSLSSIYVSVCVYIIPVSLVMYIYIKLVLYVKGMSKRIVPVNTLFRARRDLKMASRIVILINILLIGGFPMTLFIFLSFGNLAPKYHFRIGYLFVYVSILFIMITLFQFTDLLKASVKKLIYGQRNMVFPMFTVNATFNETKTVANRIRENTQFQDVEVLKYRRITILRQT